MLESITESQVSTLDPTDKHLLEQFANGEEEAFNQLVERHAAMVRGVCMRVLVNSTDCDDAFQATFFVLASKAKNQVWQDSIAGWLHQVARRVSLKLRADLARRKQLETHSVEIRPHADADPTQNVALRELGQILDDEIAKLPEPFREAIILTQIEGLSRIEAALRAGTTVASIKDRLERGRELLQRRLTRRGLTVTSVAIAAWMVPGSAQAAGLPSLIAHTAPSAIAFAGGKFIGTQISVASALAQTILKVTGIQKALVATVLLLSMITGSSVAFGFLRDNPKRFESGLRGHIVRIDQNKKPSLSIELDEYDAILELDISPKAKVWIAYEEATLGDLKVGQFVAVQLDADNRTIKEIHARGAIREVTIKAVGDDNSLTIEPDDDDNLSAPEKIRLSPETIVRIAGLSANRDDLRPGMSIPLEYNHSGEVVHAIEAEGDRNEIYEGELLYIDSQQRKLVLVVEDEADEIRHREFVLSESVTVVADGISIPLDDLRRGSLLKLRQPSDSQETQSILLLSKPDVEDSYESESL